MAPSVSLVVLTMGDRPQELTTALESALAQEGISWAEALVVFNGVPVQPVPGGVASISSAQNQGIPGGRNLGVDQTSGEVVVFLDDDARFETVDALAAVISLFGADDQLGAVGFRLVDEKGETSRRHVPRVGGRGADRSGEVTAFLGGAAAIRREAFEAAGRYAGEFFYAMEETDLAVGMIDAGYSVRYEPSVTLFHPRTEPSRHSGQLHKTARNRVLFARRRLPTVLAPVYVVNWLVITAVRSRLRLGPLRAHLRGTVDGLRAETSFRRPISWGTVGRLCRLGRPPVV